MEVKILAFIATALFILVPIAFLLTHICKNRKSK